MSFDPVQGMCNLEIEQQVDHTSVTRWGFSIQVVKVSMLACKYHSVPVSRINHH